MATANYKTIELSSKYKPKLSEPYMCAEQLAYFYNILNNQREELLSERDEVLNAVRMADKTEAAGAGDESDNASYNQDITMDLRMSERSNKLLQKVNAALARIENGTYGFSVVSGDEIGLKRMMARPLATMTVEEQEEYEARKK
ncbi:MAG: RNA polymerase-binding protein DksA [Alphaproteobacteria bacterium]|nr:RNA polymerase-binding protein DksA [Alphaproteobacteria bacterium]MBQ8729392.1 RNA polymerase-binding protein DksA [Alphaproteobacteria bacterium]